MHMPMQAVVDRKAASIIDMVFYRCPPPLGEERAGGEGSGSRSGKKFTWEELAELNSRHNAHISIRGKVYDVTGFVSRHPGGVDQIMLGAGRDATQLFESYHKLDTHRVLEKFYVGELVTREYPWFPEPSEFYVTLRQRVEAYFRENNIDPKVDWWMFARYAFIYLSCVLLFGGAVALHHVWLVSLLMAALWGVFSALVTLTPGHDSSHFAVTHKPAVWKWLGYAHECYHGVSMFCWIHQHVVGHHIFTNIDGADPDVYTDHPDKPFYLRIKWKQKWLPHYLYQHFYIFVIYSLLAANKRVQDFGYMFGRRNGAIRFSEASTSQWSLFWSSKVVYCVYRFLLPLPFIPFWRLVLLNAVSDAVCSYLLAFFFQSSHNISEVEWPTPDQDNFLGTDWAVLQVQTTQDHATDSWFWTFLTGALNHQTTHHLFPGVIQSHYPEITPIVAQTCREFGVTYHYVDSTKEALGCHINHLKRLGRVPSKEHSVN